MVSDRTSIFFLVNYQHNIQHVLPFYLRNGDEVFELRWCFRTYHEGAFNMHYPKLLFKTYMRHGNGGHDFHHKWWNTICSKLPVQHSSPYIDSTSSYVLAYVKLSSHEMSSIRAQMMNYIGGQSHYYCKIHKLPVIISTARHGTSSNANCSRKEHYVCPKNICNTVVCKPCVDSTPDNVITFSNDGLTGMDVDNNILEEPYADMDWSNNDSRDNDNDDEFMELMNDYLTTDGTIGVDSDFFIMNQNKCSSDDDSANFDILTTDAGDIPFEIKEDSTYRGQFGNITISGHVLLNQCGSLLTRKNDQI